MLWFLDILLKNKSKKDKFITINKQAKLLHKKEQEIYKQTMKFVFKVPSKLRINKRTANMVSTTLSICRLELI